MFENVDRVPGDAILGLIQEFQADNNPNKVDLGVGVYRDEYGRTPILETVHEAEKTRLTEESTKTYIGSHGDPEFGDSIQRLVFGAASPVLAANRATATQAPGGTGALRLAGDFCRTQFPTTSIWLPTPTWPNHIGLFEAAGLPIKRYTYVDDNNQLDFAGMLADLKSIPAGDIVLLHACCHNPSGFDLNREQWQQVVDVVRDRGVLPLVDFAYQGFGNGLEDDAFGPRLVAESCDEALITQSCSKNFGLYRERIGCLIAVARDESAMTDVRSQLATTARGNYSNPPAHGGAIVSTILNSEELSARWRDEVSAMRSRINALRSDLVDALAPYGLEQQFGHIANQRGMFSYTGLNSDQVERLKNEYSIYMVASGRANVAGLRQDNLDYVAGAISDVVNG
ncbi:amino acid aminotransferase [Salinisphaera orenii]|uniref:amino acid aminotransferase n=1 Tax=Salinisphaera orenii TaxID=856731 RepID=UPI000DBE36E7